MTVTSSWSASATVMAKAVIACPCWYDLAPGAVITGAAFGGGGGVVTVMVKVPVTAVLTPSLALMVTV